MDFKPVICPSCGGRVQLPAGGGTATCGYCGNEIISLGNSAVAKPFTKARTIEKTYEWKPFDFDRGKRQARNLSLALIIVGLVSWSIAGGSFGVILMLSFLSIALILFAVQRSRLNAVRSADNEMVGKGERTAIEAYAGLCPYCDSEITLRASSAGSDCPVCLHRIVIKDSRFYSVALPTVSVERAV